MNKLPAVIKSVQTLKTNFLVEARKSFLATKKQLEGVKKADQLLKDSRDELYEDRETKVKIFTNKLEEKKKEFLNQKEHLEATYRIKEQEDKDKALDSLIENNRKYLLYLQGLAKWDTQIENVSFEILEDDFGKEYFVEVSTDSKAKTLTIKGDPEKARIEQYIINVDKIKAAEQEIEELAKEVAEEIETHKKLVSIEAAICKIEKEEEDYLEEINMKINDSNKEITELNKVKSELSFTFTSLEQLLGVSTINEAALSAQEQQIKTIDEEYSTLIEDVIEVK